MVLEEQKSKCENQQEKKKIEKGKGKEKEKEKRIKQKKKFEKHIDTKEEEKKLKTEKNKLDGVHEGKKPYVCALCDQKFATKGNFFQHIEKHHDATKNKITDNARKFVKKIGADKMGIEQTLGIIYIFKKHLKSTKSHNLS